MYIYNRFHEPKFVIEGCETIKEVIKFKNKRKYKINKKYIFEYFSIKKYRTQFKCSFLKIFYIIIINQDDKKNNFAIS